MLTLPATSAAVPVRPRTPGTPDQIAPSDALTAVTQHASQSEYHPRGEDASASPHQPAFGSPLQSGVGLYQQIYRETADYVLLTEQETLDVRV